MTSFLVNSIKCGAKITQPVCPVQCSTSNAASLSGKSGSPAFPKIDSTKSKLLTKPPGAKKRISIVCSWQYPGTLGRTSGLMSNETHVETCSVRSNVKGTRRFASGAATAARNNCMNTCLGTARLSPAIGSPPSAT